MSKKIVITADSTCDLSPELCERYGIKICPRYTILDDKQYRDNVEITPDEIYDFVKKNGRLPKSSAGSVTDAIDFLKSVKTDDNEIIHFTISSKMSVNYNNSCLAAEELGDEGIHIVDGYNLSTGIALRMLYACDLAAAGLGAKEIVKKVNDLALYVDASFIPDTLDYLHKGGRCSAVAALGANLLKLKPCIEVKDGAMGVGKKYRGRFVDVLKEYAHARLADVDDLVLDRVFITHSGCEQSVVDEVEKTVKECAPFKEVLVTRAGCTISTHCGPGTLGVLFIRKSEVK